MKPEDKIGPKLHLDERNWPEGLDGASDTFAALAWRGFTKARQLYDSFEEARANIEADPNLSPLGKKGALASLAEQVEEELEPLAKQVSAHAEEVAATVREKLRAPYTKPPKGEGEHLLQREVRDWIRSLPENERLHRIISMARGGDRSALQAALGAPHYVSGLDQKQLHRLVEFLGEQDHPELAEKADRLARAHRAAFNALSAVRTYAARASAAGAPKTPAAVPQPREERMAS